LNTANKTVEACAEWVSAFWRSTPINHNAGPVCLLPPHINHNVGSAWLELVANSLLCKIDKNRGWPQAYLFTSHTKKWSYWRVESTPTRAYV